MSRPKKKRPLFSARVLKTARAWAALDPVFGIPDLNAAIQLGKAVLRAQEKTR